MVKNRIGVKSVDRTCINCHETFDTKRGLQMHQKNKIQPRTTMCTSWKGCRYFSTGAPFVRTYPINGYLVWLTLNQGREYPERELRAPVRNGRLEEKWAPNMQPYIGLGATRHKSMDKEARRSCCSSNKTTFA